MACQGTKTRKRVSGKPVCSACFHEDAVANKNRRPDYSELTPPARIRNAKAAEPETEETAEETPPATPEELEPAAAPAEAPDTTGQGPEESLLGPQETRADAPS